MTTLSIRVSEKLRGELETRARREGRSLTQVALDWIERGRASLAGNEVDVVTLIGSFQGQLEEFGELLARAADDSDAHQKHLAITLDTLVKVATEALIVVRHMAHEQDPAMLKRAQVDARRAVEARAPTAPGLPGSGSVSVPGGGD